MDSGLWPLSVPTSSLHLALRSAHSSSGLGHRPLTAAARVRIPYGPFRSAWLCDNRMAARVRRVACAANAHAVQTRRCCLLRRHGQSSRRARAVALCARARSRPVRQYELQFAHPDAVLALRDRLEHAEACEQDYCADCQRRDRSPYLRLRRALTHGSRCPTCRRRYADCWF